MQSSPLRPEQVQYLLTTLETDYKQVAVAYRNSWCSSEHRASALQTLVGSVAKARHATESLKGTSDPALRQLISKLIVQSDLADDSCKHPETLKV